jgi:hypothetical protein
MIGDRNWRGSTWRQFADFDGFDFIIQIGRLEVLPHPRGNDVIPTRLEVTPAITWTMTDPTTAEILNKTPGELPSSKRLKRDYMAYSGPRKPRVGEEFQVMLLPSPDEARTTKLEESSMENQAAKE